MLLYVVSFCCGAFAVACEALMRQAPSYFAWSWFFIPAALVMSILVYAQVRLADSLVGAFVVFSMFTSLLRIAVTVWLGQPLGWRTLAAAGMVVLANVVKGWRGG